MNYVYLDFLETLQSMFQWLVDKVVAPILSDILMVVVKLIGDLLHDIFGKFLLQIFCIVLRLTDYIAKLFNIIAGITPIEFHNEEMTFLEAMLSIKGIGQAFWLLTTVAMVLSFLFTIISVMRSVADSAFENRHPISHALTQGIKSALTFFLIPMLCLTLLQLSNVVINAINKVDYTQTRATQTEIVITGTTPGDVIFSAMTSEAMKYPSSIANNESAREQYKARMSAAYLTRQPGPTSTIYVYENIEQVLLDFDYKKINYVTAILVALSMSLMMLASGITLIKRCFDLLLLYLVSPFFAASMAYDDGKMFKRWQDAFVARFFAGMGTLLSMKCYLIFLPFIVNNRFEFVNNSLINSLITTLFALGGMWAIFKSNVLLMQILDQDVAEEEARNSQRMSGYMMGRLLSR